MPIAVTLLRIFVASPGDVKNERLSVKKVIDELNLVIVDSLQMKFEFVGWETHSYPSFGEDAQDVINKQIKDNYDIFLGIMWKRFGTPTLRNESGTKEEFEKAFERYKNDSAKNKILFYFKTSTPASLDDIDVEQLMQVKNFKKDLGELGSYHFDFNTIEEFEQLLRLHLSKIAKEYKLENANVQNEIEIKRNEELLNSGSEELGIYEYSELTAETFEENASILNRMSNDSLQLTEKINSTTLKLNRLVSADQSTKQREAKRLCDLLADEYLNYAKRTNIEIAYMKEVFEKGIHYYTQTITVYKTDIGLKEEEANVLSITINNLKEIMLNNLSTVNSFKESVEQMPRMTNKLIKARREMASTLEKLIQELKSQINLLDQIDKEI